MKSSEIAKMKKINYLEKQLEKKISELENFKDTINQTIEQNQKLMAIRQKKFEKNIKEILEQELDKVHENHEAITNKVEKHAENVSDVEEMIRELKNTEFNNKQKIQILAEELENILNDMNKKLMEKDKKIEALRKEANLVKKPEEKERVFREINILKKIEKKISKKEHRQEEEGLLEKIHFPLVPKEKEEKERTQPEKYIKLIKKAEKRRDYAIEIARILKTFIQDKLNIKSELTYHELLGVLKRMDKIHPEVKKQLTEFFGDIVKLEYAGEKIKFSKPKELSKWAQELIKIFDLAEEHEISKYKKSKKRR